MSDIQLPNRWSPIPAASEIERVLYEFNDTAADYPQRELIHEVFEHQVRRTPGALAAIYERQRLTYDELNSRANQLAHYLQGEGVGVGEYVPLAMPRCLQMLIAQLAVLKCGAVYVPIDPQLPVERQLFLIRDCGARRVVAEQGMCEEFSKEAIQWIDCSSVAEEVGSCPRGDLALKIAVPLAAYVMYTSGSTGIPKGVVVTHRAVNRLVINNSFAHIESSDRIVHCSNTAFDASTFEIWAALLNGASVLIVPHSVVLEARQFAEVLLAERATVLWLTTGLFVQYTESLSSVFKRLRYLITGGDTVDPNAVRRVIHNGAPRYLLNAYGPTECTTFSTTYLISAVDEDAKILPIGRPISNTKIYILDSNQLPVPVGITGEIYIGGPGVAREYLNRPALTAERFIADPFSANPGERLYRSGDLGRWDCDGNVEFLGRRDRQVKLRGFRIELEEIEQRLLQCSYVSEAAVVVREDAAGDKRVVAYVTLRHEGTQAVEELRAHLKSVLPEYMVPSAFVSLKSLPLTASGKIDRRALPTPGLESYSSREYEAPQGDIENLLAEIWRGLLCVKQVGRRDNFFEIGGHSLMLVHMLEKLRQVGLATDVGSVYSNPTLADLASTLIDETIAQIEIPKNLIPSGCEAISPQMLPLVALQPEHIDRIVRSVPGGAANVQDIYPLTSLQEGLLFHHELDGRRGDTYVLPLLLSFSSAQRLAALIAALQDVIDRHDILRTAILSEQLPQPVQVVYRRASLPVERLQTDPGRCVTEQFDELLEPEVQSLDMRRAPLMKLQVVEETRSSKCYAVLKIHHVICDHESVEIMLAEVKAYVEGNAQDLPRPPPYRNHVAQLLAYEKTHASEPFFRTKLAGIDETTAPFGLLDVRSGGARIARAWQSLEAALAKRVRILARQLGVSPAPLFHAAWAVLVSRTSGRDDVVFGTVLLGRLRGSAGAQRTLGMFINTLPLRLRLQGLNAKQLVVRIQRELVELLNYDHASLSVAQRCSGMTGSAPLFSSLINYLHSTVNIETGQPSLASGIQVVASREWTNYPMTLSVGDQGEGFVLDVETDRRIDPHRVVGYMNEAMRSLVHALEHEPQTLIQDLSIIPEGERCQVIGIFNATQADYPKEKLIHELFEDQANRTPDAKAVVCDERSLTYAELNGRANQLARYLRRQGVHSDTLVALGLERSVDMLVGLLAILKAGGAYVPLDISYPSERLAYLLKDSSPLVLLTQERLKGVLPACDARVISLDAMSDEIRRESDRNLDTTALSSMQRAYIIYTSGSTGLPKGVMVEHRSLVNLARWHCSVFDLTEGCHSSSVAAIGFDAAAWEIWPPLIVGATLVLASQKISTDAEALLAWWANQSLDVGFLPTPIAELAFSQNLRNEKVRTLLVGGDRLRSHSSSQSSLLVNNYGPTEATVVATSGRIHNGDEVLHIGRPIANTQVYILDGCLHPAPIGAAGEMYIGGAGVARGYMNRFKLTAERFIADPYAGVPNARMYKSGDLGRWRADGTIEYLGRGDDQVKIRGFRIELGEVEARLLQHPLVKEAVVLAREDKFSDRRLVAYVVADLARMKALQMGVSDKTGETVDQWRRLYNETYSSATSGPSFVGWNSSYTGQPIAEAQMQEWRACTVERIQALRPKRMLEIGCGVGLLLERLAPQCEVYVGTDFSVSAIDQLSQWTSVQEDLKHVELLHRSATELQDLQSGSFDTVVLNSVAQYFPDIDYLLVVLEGALRLLQPGGKIFLGDIRHLGLLPMFHGAVQLSKASASVSVGQLRRRIVQSLAQDKELVIDPQLFEMLPGRMSGISAAEVQLKRGTSDNELTRYRYDVTLHTGERIANPRVYQPLDWHADVKSIAELGKALKERRWGAAHVISIPNSRLAKEEAAQRLIEASDERLDVGTLRRQINELQVEAVSPEQIWELADAHGYEVTARPSERGYFDVQLMDRARVDQVQRALPAMLSEVKPWAAYANDPLEHGFRQQLMPQLRDYLKEQLPEYMIPSAWMVLKQLPLTPNGKVDRRALPNPQGRPEEMGDYIAPRTELERSIAKIWAQLLRVDQIGLHDNFFEIGGHSLLATRVTSHISRELDMDLPLRVLFEKPTIEALSNHIVQEISAEVSMESP